MYIYINIYIYIGVIRSKLWAWNGLPLNTYISMYARKHRCSNERGSRTSYVRSSVLHSCVCVYIYIYLGVIRSRLWACNALPLNKYISMYARTNRCYNERDSRNNYFRSTTAHCNSPLKSSVIPYNEWLSKEMIIRSTNVTDLRTFWIFFIKNVVCKWDSVIRNIVEGVEKKG